MKKYSVPARPELSGVIDDPLFENLGVIDKFRGSELFSSPELAVRNQISSGASFGWGIDFERFTHAQMVSLKIDLVHWWSYIFWCIGAKKIFLSRILL